MRGGNALLSANNSENVYYRAREIILSGEYNEVVKINQVELAQKLNVSRTPVIKALYRLTSEGVIENIPNKGFYVINYTVSEMVDLLKIRLALDQVLAENIMLNITEKDIEKLYKMFAPFENCNWTEEDNLHYLDIDKKFHETLIQYCSNQWVKKINDSLHIYGRVSRVGLVRPAKQTYGEHLNIIKAIENRDVKQLIKELNLHIQASIDVFQNTIKAGGSLGI